MNMELNPADITIAITVYDRRDFLEQAIDSALNQTVPVKIMVVEDCGPDLTLQSWVKSKYGSRLEYIRNPRRRGLFDNWNACLDYCRTPWLSILHDDDYLKPTFVETMLGLHQAAPGRGLYFGGFMVVDHHGQIIPFGQAVVRNPWQDIDLRSLADENVLGFAGHFFPVAAAKRAGGFRAASIFCGDWEMWFRLVAQLGGVHTGTEVVFVRSYEDWRKGTTQVVRTGKNYAATIVQRKRNYAYLKVAGLVQAFDVQSLCSKSSMTSRHLILHGASSSRRLFNYNVKLFQTLRPVTPGQKLFQCAVRLAGPGFVRCLSRLWRLGSRCP